MEHKSTTSDRHISLLILVAALGYFVDIYDLLIFSIVRIESLKDIGIPDDQLRHKGEYVMNMQMTGLLLGGLLWGILGDKVGRVKVLFGSIFLYSLANIINGFVNDIHSYAFIRFIAGIGLAGELGAGITLISETMSKEKRGYGTMIVAVIGVLGAVAAKLVSEAYTWRIAYFVGGALGFALLLFRLGTFESGFYKNTVAIQAKRGNLRMLFSRQRFAKYLCCIGIGLPLWFVVGILIALSPEFGRALKATGPLKAGEAIMYAYIGISIGDIIAGLLAQRLKSRKRIILLFTLSSVVISIYYLNSTGITPERFNILAFVMGLSVGYWATFVTIASEQFGTNLRATVTTTVPNFVRGALVPITLLFEYFVHHFNIITAAYIMLFFLATLALFSLSRIKETFGKDLNYLEE